MAPKIGRIAGGVFVASAALLGFLIIRSPAKVPEAEPTNGRERRLEVPLPPAQALPQTNVALASVAAPIMPVGSKPPEEELPHPHPVTPQHERIYRENDLTFWLDGAVDAEDVPGIRRLLSTYRQEFPEDSLVLQQGYELIADCLQRPGEATRAAAQRFYDSEIASALRRHVRRHCLERP